MKYVRALNLLAQWKGESLIIQDFYRRRSFSGAPVAIELLHAFSRPRAVEAVVRELPDYTPTSLRRAIADLCRCGLLERAPGNDRHKPSTETWPNGFAAAHYHFANRDPVYLSEPQEQLRFLRERLGESPQPAIYKEYPRKPCVNFPGEKTSQSPAWTRLLRKRRTVRQFSAKGVALADFCALVRSTWGQTAWIDGGPFGKLLAKTSPSAGARHPIECYVIAWNVQGLDPGLYHYNVRVNCLERLRRGDFRDLAVEIASKHGWIRDAAFLCVMTAVVARTFWKYPSSGAYKLFYLDAGHLAQTFCLLATGAGLGPFTTAAIQHSRTERFLGIDGIKEFPVYLCGAGVAAAGASSGDIIEADRRPSSE